MVERIFLVQNLQDNQIYFIYPGLVPGPAQSPQDLVRQKVHHEPVEQPEGPCQRGFAHHEEEENAKGEEAF